MILYTIEDIQNFFFFFFSQEISSNEDRSLFLQLTGYQIFKNKLVSVSLKGNVRLRILFRNDRTFSSASVNYEVNLKLGLLVV